ncbi:PREDICTED: G protein-activated inward rectifier potassium channel 4-like [Pygoscelis adeliae]|uniref:G protein-activated inward rectifier potassium channel 4-like n=1 Tax=Pygoscelis adeliae TaxID=9238 RepID=UPI0004F4F1F6|nr:PREDICTED: G protein-activated inward rectifier potassium channel 4-like [Pygoscelis adeliae]
MVPSPRADGEHHPEAKSREIRWESSPAPSPGASGHRLLLIKSSRGPAPQVLEEDGPVVQASKRQRYVTKVGKCQVNLGNIQEKKRFLSDVFTTIVDLKYRWFLFVFMMCCIVTWVVFGTVYFFNAWAGGDIRHRGDPERRVCIKNVDGFVSTLLFSVESQRPIRKAPSGWTTAASR